MAKSASAILTDTIPNVARAEAVWRWSIEAKFELDTRKKIPLRLPPGIGGWLVTIPAVWFVLVIVQGVAAYHGVQKFGVNFSLSGQFGDSFGALSALMASVAAIGAWAAVSEQREALETSKQSAVDLEKSARKRDFEATFFNLLSTFLRLGEGIDVGGLWSRKVGKDAFSEFVRQIYAEKSEEDAGFKNAYLLTFFKYEDDLAHYIRNIFNIIHFVKDSAPENPYFYVRLLRSTLSQPELVILALNGLFHDEGIQDFKPLIEEFALLNNISAQARADFDLETLYGEGAFKSKFARRTAAGAIDG